MSKDPTIIELDMDELDEMLRRAEARQFRNSDYETAKALFQSYVHLVELLKDKNTSIRRLRKMFFGSSTEKTASLMNDAAEATVPLEEDASKTASQRDPS